MEPTLDVVGVGNAIVDVISTVDDDFITAHSLNKGAMTLIDADRATSLYAAMPPGIEASGGSAANTMAGLASLGSRSAYLGKVRDDQLGEVFIHDLRAAGVGFDVDAGADGPPTARCLIQVTPDAERTMNTFLGISAFLSPNDIDDSLVASAAITYCEGYLWDMDIAKEAIRGAMAVAAEAGRTVSLTLSDSFCVDRHRDEWLELLADKVDLVFANEAEICALFETEDFDSAADQIAQLVEVSALTRSAAGSVVVRGDERIVVAAAAVDAVVDATGAGDLYASGFLHGLANGADLARCAELGGIAAGEIISHIGARPHVGLASLV
ncbi:MAG: adenosine kinase [Acidimicrobiales bacterium]|nr:MAG: adenosine kinase [Acidimicrobiales bacterium]